MSLKAQLEEYRKAASAKYPNDALQVLRDFVEKLEREHVAENAKKSGEKAPDFTLVNASGEAVSLSGLLEQGPIVLSFYRGGWCPYCNLELKALQDALPEIQELGAQLVAISPQLPDQSLSTVEKNELQFPVLSDVGNTVAGKFGLVFTLPEEIQLIYKKLGIDLTQINGDESWQLPLTSTFVIDTNGTIISAHNSVYYHQRMDPEEILVVLRDGEQRKAI